jgi:hypothetical protein
MPDPKADNVKCDVPGCNHPASYRTDGKEKDTHTRRLGKTAEDGTIIEPARDEPLNRPGLPNLNICFAHKNWPHSEDAQAFAVINKEYKARKS